jgi:hypothetical protein
MSNNELFEMFSKYEKNMMKGVGLSIIVPKLKKVINEYRRNGKHIDNQTLIYLSDKALDEKIKDGKSVDPNYAMDEQNVCKTRSAYAQLFSCVFDNYNDVDKEDRHKFKLKMAPKLTDIVLDENLSLRAKINGFRSFYNYFGDEISRLNEMRNKNSDLSKEDYFYVVSCQKLRDGTEGTRKHADLSTQELLENVKLEAEMERLESQERKGIDVKDRKLANGNKRDKLKNSYKKAKAFSHYHESFVKKYNKSFMPKYEDQIREVSDMLEVKNANNEKNKNKRKSKGVISLLTPRFGFRAYGGR